VRRRYLALKIDSDETFNSKDFMDTVWSAVSKLYGEYGASQTGLTLIDYNMEKGFAVIRTAHTAVNMVRTALASITKIGNKPASIHVLTVSGTIRALYKKLE
jgi:ribonuclease P/MRP protein subunit POP5